LKLRLWRPFPYPELRKAVGNAENLVVVDRALSFGGCGGPSYSEVRSALYSEKNHPKVVGFVAGLGGRISPWPNSKHGQAAPGNRQHGCGKRI